MTTVRAACPQCGKPLSILEIELSRNVTCPQCGKGFVPAASSGTTTAIADSQSAPEPPSTQSKLAFPTSSSEAEVEAVAEVDPLQAFLVEQARNDNPFATPLIDLIDPHRTAEQRKLASLLQRFTGSLLDTTIAGICGLLAIYLIVKSAGMPDPMYALQKNMGRTAVWFYAGVLPVTLVQAILISNTGRSIGKFVVGTRIVTVDDEPAGFVHGYALRDVPVMVIGAMPVIGPLFTFFDAIAVFSANRRCIHDHIAGTKVVRIRQ